MRCCSCVGFYIVLLIPAYSSLTAGGGQRVLEKGTVLYPDTGTASVLSDCLSASDELLPSPSYRYLSAVVLKFWTRPCVRTARAYGEAGRCVGCPYDSSEGKKSRTLAAVISLGEVSALCCSAVTSKQAGTN